MTELPDDRPVLPDRGDDEHDVGWGERGSTSDDDGEGDDTRRLLAQLPPHHVDRD